MGALLKIPASTPGVVMPMLDTRGRHQRNLMEKVVVYVDFWRFRKNFVV